jgi:hypothetical protein
MSDPNLLKAPARVLLLTFVMSARMAVAAPATAPQVAPMPGQGQHLVATTRPRVRHPLQEMDAYVLRYGVPRWALTNNSE